MLQQASFWWRAVHAARSKGRICLALMACMSLAGLCTAEDPLDWPMWRGPEMNGVSREKGLVDKWSPKGENLLWVKPEYASRSTPIVMNGKLYVVCRHEPETTKEGEKTVCVDAKTGNLIWESIHNVYLSDAPAERVGWSSVVGDPATGNVFVLGLGCQFQCLDGNTGKVLWEHSMSEEYGMLSTYGGRTNFPMVFEDLVIISGVMTSMVTTLFRPIALSPSTNAPAPRSGSSVRVCDPRTRLIARQSSPPSMARRPWCWALGMDRSMRYNLEREKTIWSYNASTRGLNSPPIVVDNVVYIGHGERNVSDPNILGAALAFDGRAEGEIKEDKLLWKIPARRSAALVLSC